MSIIIFFYKSMSIIIDTTGFEHFGCYYIRMSKKNSNSLRLCLVPKKFDEKCKKEKIERKSKRIEKINEDKDKVKSYILFQTHFIYLNLLI